MLPSQLDVSVSPWLTGARHRVLLDVVSRPSRRHPVTARARRRRRRRRRVLEVYGRLVGAEVLLVGQNVAPRRRRLATVNQTTTQLKPLTHRLDWIGLSKV